MTSARYRCIAPAATVIEMTRRFASWVSLVNIVVFVVQPRAVTPP